MENSLPTFREIAIEEENIVLIHTFVELWGKLSRLQGSSYFNLSYRWTLQSLISDFQGNTSSQRYQDVRWAILLSEQVG